MASADAIIPSEKDVAFELEPCVCGTAMSEPRLLKCLHVLGSCCTKLEQLGDNYWIVRCPLCCFETCVIDGDLDLLPPALFLHKLKKSKKPACELCSSATNATARCENCAQFICDEHKQLHTKIPSLTDHLISPLHKISEKEAETEHAQSICRKHFKPLQSFCGECGFAVCSECQVTHHKDHKFTKLAEILKISETSIAMQLKSLKQRVQTTESHTPVVQSQVHSLAEMFESKVNFLLFEDEFLLHRIQQISEFGSLEERLHLFWIDSGPRFFPVPGHSERSVLVHALPPDDEKEVVLLTLLKNEKESRVKVTSSLTSDPSETRRFYAEAVLPPAVDTSKLSICVQSDALTADQKWELLAVGDLLRHYTGNTYLEVTRVDVKNNKCQMKSGKIITKNSLKNYLVFSQHLPLEL